MKQVWVKSWSWAEARRTTASAVDEPVAVDVLDDAAARPRGEHGQHGAHAPRDRGGATGLQLKRLRAGDGGDDAALLRNCGHEGLPDDLA
jgi:hypothetical protein